MDYSYYIAVIIVLVWIPIICVSVRKKKTWPIAKLRADGGAAPNAKLTTEEMYDVEQLYSLGHSCQELSTKYNTTKAGIRQVVSRVRGWKASASNADNQPSHGAL